MSRKKLLSVMLSFSLAATTVFSNFGWSSTTANVRAAETETETVVDETQVDADSYGLCKNIQDGVILHCFDWKYNDIKAELPNIAKAGFTAVQTSPAQRDDSFGVWYMLYQPQSFSISTNALGSKADLQALCEEADKYGVKVIVDVVANHMRGDGYDVDGNMSRSNHPDYWHDTEGSTNDGDRWSVTHDKIGMKDLNSEHSEVQKIVKGYIEELKGVGVDGIRWDAAKHIGLPSEGCDFWKTVTSVGIYNYGEILNTPGGGSPEALMKEYTQYMSVTDGGNIGYCTKVRDEMAGGKATGAIGNWSERGVNKGKLVYWAESHDTYSNDGEYGEATQNMDQNVIDRTWAIVAGQGKATSLYFSRPSSKSKQSIKAGQKGSTHFTAKEVAAVNHMHNACVGQKDYYVNGGDKAAVCRETGAVIVKCGGGSGQVTIQNGGSLTKPGTYTDEVSGSTWTVTADTISGNVGDTGIAVIYDGSVTGGGDDTETTAPTKTNPPVVDNNTKAEANTIVATMPSGWSDLYIYAYEPGTPGKELTGKWPGTKMTAGSDGKYTYKMDATVKSAKVIFASGPSGSQDPANVLGEACGYDYVGGKAYSYSGGTWSEVSIATVTKEPEKTKEPTKEPTKTEEPQKTEQPTATPKVTEEPQKTEQPTEQPTEKPTEAPKVTPTVTPTVTPKVTATETPTAPPAATPTPTPEVTPTVKPTATASGQNMTINTVPDNSVATQGAVYYKITYQMNGGYFAVGAPNNYTGEEDIALRIPVREGYTFAGWYTDSAFNQKISVIKTGTKGDITVYAKWKKVSKPGKPVIATIKKSNSKKKIQVVLKKKVAGAYGYEAVIAKNAKFTKGRRVIRFRTLSKEINKLKAGTYYVKVRAYKVDSAGQRVYGSYCVKPKKVVLKK